MFCKHWQTFELSLCKIATSSTTDETKCAGTNRCMIHLYSEYYQAGTFEVGGGNKLKRCDEHLIV